MISKIKNIKTFISLDTRKLIIFINKPVHRRPCLTNCVGCSCEDKKKMINNCGIIHEKHSLTIFLNIRVFTREIKNLLR